jgi:hypothetical protein
MNKWNLLIAFTTLLVSFASFAQSNPGLKLKDLHRLAGSWKGTLTYLDYSSNKPYSMPADVAIKRLKRLNAFIFSNVYPDEPKANSVDTLFIAANGTMVDGATVRSKRKLSNGNTEVVTERLAKDGNDHKPATIRVTYNFGTNSFTNIKHVQFAGETEWIKRHEYSYTRN